MASAPSCSLVDVRPVVLVSIDGWGVRASPVGNAIAAAHTPNITQLTQQAVHCLLDASGLSVGLPVGVMGNSEVGHLTMGAGRVSFQDLVRINKDMEDGEIRKNKALLDSFAVARNCTGRVHFLGLLSDGGVHSHISHLFDLLRFACAERVPHAFVHAFADGRDTPPTSGTQYVEQLVKFMEEQNYGSLGSVSGRYYGMDRDKRWERIKVAYDALCAGVGAQKSSKQQLIQCIQSRYEQGENDEFLKPILVDESSLIGDGDVVIFFDFRSDRMRQIVSVFNACVNNSTPDDFPFKPAVCRNKLHVVQMTQYDEKVLLPTVFPPQTMVNGLPQWISKHGLKQFHTAETEKYAHVTFFFAGGQEAAFPLEDRELIASPKVATYDLAPEMSQHAVGQSVIAAMAQKQYPFIMCNLAAPDMVGHTGVFDKAVIACTACDRVIGDIWAACQKHGYILVVTADHGNAEEMLDESGQPKTSHTTNLIPLIVADPTSSFELVSSASSSSSDASGGLSDVAPTVLTLMGLTVPPEMTGRTLVRRK